MDFEAIFKELKNKVFELAGDMLGEYISQAEEDGKEFLESLKGDLERWTKALENGELKPDEFKFLLEAEKQTAECRVLYQVGVAKTQIDGFKNKLFDLVAKTIIGKLL